MDRRIEVKIPAGIHDGQAVRIAGEGEPPPQESDPAGSGTRGDLHVVTRVGSMNNSNAMGITCSSLSPVSFTQLALGSTVEVPGLGEGEVHLLELPPGTQHGALFRISGGGAAGPPVPTSGVTWSRSYTWSYRRNSIPSSENVAGTIRQTEELDVDASNPSLWNRIKDAVTGRG